jgi:hypothetical protein
MSPRKTYSIEERMPSGVWVERFAGFTSVKKARAYLRKRADFTACGPLRLVKTVRTLVR